MKKKFFLSAVVMLSLGALAGCGSGGGEGSSSAADEELNIGLVKVMCDQKVHTTTENQIKAFMAAHPKYKMSYEIKEGSESNAADTILQDVDAAPDVYFFAQDQLARLVNGSAIAKVPNAYINEVTNNNYAESVASSKVGNDLYAYPATADNTYFLYYNKDVLSSEDVKSFEKIVEVSKAASKKVYFEFSSSAWYLSSMFFGAGLKSNWTVNEKGKFTAYDDNFNSEVGKTVVDAIHNLFSDTTVAVSSSANGAFDEGAAALISGTWASGDVKTALGDKMGIAVLPSFKAGTNNYKMKPFGGFKLVGVKPQEQIDRVKGLSQLAMYLTNESSQTARFDEFGWGPSNKAARELDKVKNDPLMSVVFQQMDYSVTQGQFPGDWWSAAALIGENAVKATYNPTTILAEYASTLEGCIEN